MRKNLEPLSENKPSELTGLSELERKVKELVKKYYQLKEKYRIALEEIEKLEKESQQQRHELNNFQNQFKISKIVTSIADEQPDHTQLKSKINEYIREIDKCIAHLSE